MGELGIFKFWPRVVYILYTEEWGIICLRNVRAHSVRHANLGDINVNITDPLKHEFYMNYT